MAEPINQTVTQIASALGETEVAPIAQIRHIVTHFGPAQALAWLHDTQQLEAQGGMLIPDGSRRRTPGGVFFALVKGTLSKKERRRFFRPTRPQQPPPTPGTTPTSAAPRQGPLTEAERTAFSRESMTHPGKATSVKITLIGRPGRVVEKKDVVLTTMQNDKAPSFPKGLPAPPPTSTSYTVYISSKQWKGVAQAIQNEEDALILEGWAAYDPELEGVAVWVTSCTTKLLQRAKREAQQQP